MIEKRPELYVIREPETPAQNRTLHLSGGIRSNGPTKARPVGRPWPRQVAWRDSLRRAKAPKTGV